MARKRLALTGILGTLPSRTLFLHTYALEGRWFSVGNSRKRMGRMDFMYRTAGCAVRTAHLGSANKRSARVTDAAHL
ncbi:uncharacterized protein EI90DRAFT_655241 [Cantharellus anzutake]|uniref:uncharacterized protein n=1 Tax=Cantharellus anzutake TaxID=1750568 RepID=UPI001903E944|nr:uncharacterized protein EI90DRAFT_655241 [Cantharellus anzutake]KAF8312590.1 hypothetical protein EI90DRAFT_655241 [Cantharellus anzutake]